MFKFEIVPTKKYKVKRYFTGRRRGHYNPRYHNIGTVLGDAIELIEYAGLIRFQIWGFAPEPWGSIYDLMYLTEELPGFTKWLLEPSGVGHIDLPEQGTQRKLNFTLSGSIVTVSCAPYYINFTPDPEFEYIELEDLKDMTRNLVVDYLYYASKYASRVYNHPWFQDWCNSIDEQFRTPPT